MSSIFPLRFFKPIVLETTALGSSHWMKSCFTFERKSVKRLVRSDTEAGLGICFLICTSEKGIRQFTAFRPYLPALTGNEYGDISALHRCTSVTPHSTSKLAVSCQTNRLRKSFTDMILVGGFYSWCLSSFN